MELIVTVAAIAVLAISVVLLEDEYRELWEVNHNG